MTPILIPCLRLAGVGLIVLALLHVPIGRRLKWREDAARMSRLNATVFHVHAFFLCLVLVAMGLPCLLDPHAFLEDSRASAWAAWTMTAFWLARLCCEWFVYDPSWWRGKRFETALHWSCTLAWSLLVLLFGLCGSRHLGWIA